MSCSKIFSGDLPELTHEILQYFHNDFPTLHSCILVNRLWCHLSIPLLWENPFAIPTKNYNFIDIYLDNLNADLKTKIYKYKLNDISLPSNGLFNYPSFIKYLNTLKIITSVGKWVEDTVRTLKPGSKYVLRDLSVPDFNKLIYTSLFKMFIENGVSLHTLSIEIFAFRTYKSCYYNIFELILQNQDFIHNVSNLKLYLGSSSGFPYQTTSNDYTLVKNRILQIINLNQNLKGILLSYDNFPLYQSLLLSKDYSNTLNTITFYYVNFNDVINLDKIFDQLNVLKSVHIIYCYPLNNSFTQQIINSIKPFKLKSLFIDKISQIESLELLLQKSGDYLENFIGYTSVYNLLLKQQLLELITKYCNNLKFLGLHGFENQITYNLIENVNQNLNYLSISKDYNVNNVYNSTILQNLGPILPSKLEYLSLCLHINESDFEVFMKNSNNIFINKLVIGQNSNDDILHYIKDFIMKEKRVKYFAFRNLKNRDLSYLIDEVKEFKLHNIIVRNFNDLYLAIKSYDFARNIDYL
ncbi:hypothetical protein RclHR1_09980001 [Rhizophagus clarus]|uniref:F-box domain-containing protein n=1 Tax=Rhizophagus clarus TaxID=94130 RepID=A0A2Z6SR11_9GLOM|nr:hypothetical protein RclHR1_09980001 [Rhizophagus clarus]GES72745.1 hypothetical protein GLOIN_2v1781395 [Rhizophagus clarus]